MCGICGIVGEKRPDVLARMMQSLRHRGPDDEASVESPGASLGFRRLSIIDLAGGRQPMAGCDERFRLVFNGEIYNFRELRRELEGLGHRFATRSDAEVIVHGAEQWGEGVVTRLDGMFAFAVWDERDRSLLLARDRLGKKPLWYRQDSARLLFASEGKAILQHPDVPRRVDTAALELFLAYNHVPAPRTIYEGISKLPPAHLLNFRDGRVEVKRYWEPRIEVREARIEAHADRAFQAVTDAVKRRLMSDVPLGAFLSGGIDSSIIVGLMSLATRERVKTFSVGFEDEAYSELEHARTVSNHFRTEHHEFTAKADAAAVLPKLAWHYDEPFGDSSAVPTWIVAQLTAKHVKVALSGDGGDEVFGGYLRYQAAAKAAAIQRRPLGAMAAKLAAPFVGGGKYGRRKQRLLGMLDRPLGAVYRDLVSAFGDGRMEKVRKATDAVARHIEEPFARFEDPVTAAGYTDLVTYLPGDLLVKVDIASMGHSLEVRCPFLDPEVVAAGFAIPGAMKLRDGTKTVLKRAFKGLLPASILAREKQGFAAPVAAWLRGPLKEMVHDLVLGTRARERGFFDPAGVRELVDEHMSGKADHQDRLWLLLVFEWWARTWLDGLPSAAAPA
jgi:asparagine synthase (glutamine-hydrolysing)